MENITKKCAKCGRELPLSEFHKGNGKDGYRSECKECTHKDYEKHKARRIAYSKEYEKLYYKTKSGRASYLAHKYKQEDKKYNRDNNIKMKWIFNNIFTSKCIYCGEEDWHKLGCDRIDNSIGHIIGNVVPCCKKCNIERQRKPFEEFYALKKGVQ